MSPQSSAELNYDHLVIYGALLLFREVQTLVVSGNAKLGDNSRCELVRELLNVIQDEISSDIEADRVQVSEPHARLPVADMDRLRLIARLTRDGSAVTFVLLNQSRVEDISEITARLLLNQAQEILNLRNLSTTDHLTGLKNRRYLQNRLAELIATCGRYSHTFSLALIDIDNFKNVNTLHGYAVGDSVLTAFARFLESSLRDADLIMRYGGDEFVLIMQSTDARGCATAIKRMQDKIDEEISEIEFKDIFPLRFSAGIVDFNPLIKNRNPDELMGKADIQLRLAKRSGPSAISTDDS